MVKNEEKNNSEGTDETVLAVKSKGKARASPEQTDSARVLGDEPKSTGNRSFSEVLYDKINEII